MAKVAVDIYPAFTSLDFFRIELVLDAVHRPYDSFSRIWMVCKKHRIADNVFLETLMRESVFVYPRNPCRLDKDPTAFGFLKVSDCTFVGVNQVKAVFVFVYPAVKHSFLAFQNDSGDHLIFLCRNFKQVFAFVPDPDVVGNLEPVDEHKAVLWIKDVVVAQPTVPVQEFAFFPVYPVPVGDISPRTGKIRSWISCNVRFKAGICDVSNAS